jgi:hypothetical protein
MRQINRFETDYILMKKYDPKLTIEEEYKNLISLADRLIALTNGKINIYKTRTIKRTALFLFEDFSRNIPNPEEIDQLEKEYLEKASCGALINYENYTGEGYKYDIKSQYPSIMMSKLLMPMKKGEFNKMDKETFENLKYYPFGIYRVKIDKSEDENTNRLFRFNNYHYYTNISLGDAKMLNLKMTLIEDDEANVLSYSRDKCLIYNQIFKSFVNYLFDFKENKTLEKDVRDYIKSLINILWGSLSQSNAKRNIINKNAANEYVIKPNYCIAGIKPSVDDGDIILDIVNNEKYYTSSFARLKPFIMAKSRSQMSNILLPYKDIMKRIRTDGFILSKQPTDIKTGSNLGDLVYEGCCKELVIDCNVINKKYEFLL